MAREEIRNIIFCWLKQQIDCIKNRSNITPQLQMGSVYNLFPQSQNESSWEHEKIDLSVFEIMNELANAGFLYFGKIGGGSNDGYPWFTITEYGKDAIVQEDWIPYDPEGYIRELKRRIPNIDDITLAYIGEAVAAYNRRHLLSATITMGVASENLMLLFIESYSNWITDATRKIKFQKKIENRAILFQYKELKKEIMTDLQLFSSDFRANWETYLDSIFNFIRLNRNDAGHPTGKQFDAKIIYANLQIFADYACFIFNSISFFNNIP